MAKITTYFSQSAGKDLVIRDMPYPQLVNTINAYSRRLGGGSDDTLVALREELASRPPPGDSPPLPDSSEPAATSHALPREAKMGDNNPPVEASALRLRLEEDHAALLKQAANLEMAAAKLPAEVNSDEDVAEITAFIVLAQGASSAAEKARKQAKDPFLNAGRTVDDFFNSIATGLKNRIGPLEQRKVPYLRAKAAREQAERNARAEELRRAQAEAEERARVERQEAERARQAAAQAEEDLRRARNAEAIAEAETRARDAARKQELAEAAVAQAEKDTRKVTKEADREEKIAAGEHSRVVLGKISGGGGSSTITTTWVPEVHNRERMMASLGPLGAFLGDAAIDAALARASKADPRPAIPGVDYVEDFKARTHAARG